VLKLQDYVQFSVVFHAQSFADIGSSKSHLFRKIIITFANIIKNRQSMQAKYILHLETSTKACSVALSADDVLLDCIAESAEKYNHAEKLTGFIQSILAKNHIKFQDLSAIALSEGPGSYTGLRIGSSVAKGLCFGLQKPLIAVNSLTALCYLADKHYDFYIPALDARRNEIFTAVYDKNKNELKPRYNLVLSDDAFSDLYAQKSVLVIGDAAEKVAQNLQTQNLAWDFVQTLPSAKALVKPAWELYQNETFQDIAYFSPYYAKAFGEI
jgi:tRNA threonylcarbamoyladenosine biosynthesis protein TsaB